MKVNRNFSVFVQYILDEWVPPRIRDSKWFMKPPMMVVLKDGADDFMTFKNWFYKADSKAIGDLYERTLHLQEIQGETDLNEQCTKRILETISSNDVLEVGCGRGYLANLISKKHTITACDIVVPDSLKKKYPKIKFVSGDIENLPFKNGQFDTVVSTHTLEHTKNLQKAVSELRRVAKKELIIVVPRQRPYKYTFSLHTQFFPYEWSITNAFGYRKNSKLEKLGDWFYYEKIS
jgi:ubiquinone/menaquinone biosynthesis C-methylase UbiE